MSLLYRDSSGNETPIAGLNGLSGQLVPSVSYYQTGSQDVSDVAAGVGAALAVSFSSAMPDTDYVINIEPSTPWLLTGYSDKTTTGFTLTYRNAATSAVSGTIKWQAFKLMTDESRAVDEAQIATNTSDIASLQAVVPSGASASNQLVTVADNNFKYAARPAGITDLNDLTTPGVYSVNGNTVANTPTTGNIWWQVYVTQADGSSTYVQQLAINGVVNPTVCVRGRTGTAGWGEWQGLATESALALKAPLAFTATSADINGIQSVTLSIPADSAMHYAGLGVATVIGNANETLIWVGLVQLYKYGTGAPNAVVSTLTSSNLSCEVTTTGESPLVLTFTTTSRMYHTLTLNIYG